MSRLGFAVLVAALAIGCTRIVPPPGPPPLPKAPQRTLVGVREGFTTTLIREIGDRKPAAEPMNSSFRLVHYDTRLGPLAAYITADPNDGQKHPAIIWITGGDCNSIDVSLCEDDHSASPYRKAGIVMMFPSLRGGNDNPGRVESFLGEVDDVIAAGEYLRKQPYVDPDRIYLAGHDTGGLLVLLVAECSSRFRAVFSFGPLTNAASYGSEKVAFQAIVQEEIEVRNACRWFEDISVPTFVFEGTNGNLAELNELALWARSNPLLRFFEVPGADHVSLLAPTNRLIAEKLLKDTGPKCSLRITSAEVNGAKGR